MISRSLLSAAVLLLGGGALRLAGGAEDDTRAPRLEIEPAQIVLKDADQGIQLLVTLHLADGSLRDATLLAHYSLDPAAGDLASIHKGRITPNASGKAVLSVSVEEPLGKARLSASVPVVVELSAAERLLNFTNDVIPILTKAGCNSGGCHGKATGQNGFWLSLLGFEPDQDYDALVKEGRGRRIFPASPERVAVPEEGDRPAARTAGASGSTEDSRDYRLLRRWIDQGMPKGKPADPKVDRIEVSPRERVLTGSTQQQIRVVATFTDGSTQDVTRQAEYKSQQPDILKVEPTGTIHTLDRHRRGRRDGPLHGPGGRRARSRVPFNHDVPASAYANFKPAELHRRAGCSRSGRSWASLPAPSRATRCSSAAPSSTRSARCRRRRRWRVPGRSLARQARPLGGYDPRAAPSTPTSGPASGATSCATSARGTSRSAARSRSPPGSGTASRRTCPTTSSSARS